MIFTTQKRVRYGETDQMGFMYYGNYCLYYEIARAEMIRMQNYSYKDLENDGILMPVVKVQSKYLKPALYDELISIETKIKSLDQLPFITFLHTFYNQKKELIHKGEVTLCFVDAQTGKRTQPHDKMMDILIRNCKE